MYETYIGTLLAAHLPAAACCNKTIQLVVFLQVYIDLLYMCSKHEYNYCFHLSWFICRSEFVTSLQVLSGDGLIFFLGNLSISY